MGFVQLLAGPAYLNSFSDNLQFYYCVGFALTAFASLAGSDLYLLLIKKKRILSGMFAITCTVPACFILLFFMSAYVNAIPVALPAVPTLPWTTVYVLFFASTLILSVEIAIEFYKRKKAANVISPQNTKPSAVVQDEDEIAVLLLPQLEEDQEAV